MEVSGKIIEKFDTQQISDRFRKREFVIEYDSGNGYSESLLFQLTQDRCDILDTFQKGDEVQVSFDLKGRRWESPKGEIKYFNSLQAWKISKSGGQPSGAVDPLPEDYFEPDEPASSDDSLPF